MPAVVRLSKKELIDLIESTEAASCDAACLRGLLSEVEEEERVRRPVRRREAAPRIMAEEPTTEERLEAEVGGLFPGGITEAILAECMEMDGKYTLAELKKMCVEAGLSPSGHKKELAAKLIAKGIG
ncbi:hypothetical protein ES703_114372 [subsurface metagenome]